MPVVVNGQPFTPGPGGWKTNASGFNRLNRADRLIPRDKSISYVRYLDDFSVTPVANLWTDTRWGFDAAQKRYVVETNPQVIARCLLMTTDPGDLVLDPTCGSGTTAYVAEQWGRRWITVDTSRVSIAIARQRLLTSRFDYYELRNEKTGVAGGLTYKTVPHVTLKAIAQNTNLDPIFEKHEPLLESRLRAVNSALKGVSTRTRERLSQKLVEKQRAQGKKGITESDRRRWDLPIGGARWEHWEVPFDSDPEWPMELQVAVTEYRKASRAKMVEVNACIAANAEQEDLVDRPAVVKGIIRVSGPFTVEAVQPAELSLDGPRFGGEPAELETGFVGPEADTENARAYLIQMFQLLKQDGVRFLGNKQMKWSRLEPLFESGSYDTIHAEGRWTVVDRPDEDPAGVAGVGVVFGPQYGPVTAMMVEEAIKPAARRYDDLVIAGFSFDGPATAVIESNPHPKLRLHMAHIRPDVNPGMAGLLKEQPGNQLFTVFGQPRVRVHGPEKDGEFSVEMEGVDVYDPVTNEIRGTKADKVAAWFIDTDYDGRTFCATQAFFPDRSAWEKLEKALKGVIDPDRFDAFAGTRSLRFPPGKYRRVAIKVIDPRGNEVMTTRRLEV